MSRVSHRGATAAPRDAEALVPDAIVPRGEGLVQHLTSLVAEARSATDPHRPGMAGAIHEVMARLPSEMKPAEAAALLQRLLEEGGLEGLADEDGLPTRIAATRVLMELGYPHALEVTPEQLDAMRRWARPTPPVPWVAISATLFIAFIVQLFCISMGTHYNAFPLGLSAAALAGDIPPPEPTAIELFRRFIADTTELVMAGQLLGNFGAFVVAVAAGWHRTGHWLARNAFFGLGALGLVAGALQLLLEGWATWGTWASAAGSLVSAWLMTRER
jgi:hypothetical protein